MLKAGIIGLGHGSRVLIDAFTLNNIEVWLKEKKQQNSDYYNKLLSFLPGPLPEESLDYNFPEIANEYQYGKDWRIPKNFGYSEGIEKKYYVNLAT